MNFDLDTEEGLNNAVAWQSKLIEWIKDGGVWGVPRSNAVYTIYKTKKIVVREIGDDAVDLVFKAMGYLVKETE